MRLSRRFAADSESVRQSREFVIDALVDVPSDVQASIAMMVSELATNAFIHGGSGFEVTIERARAFIRVEVRDEGIGAPALQSPRPSEPHGRGLQIVMQLSNEWGISQEPGQAGKTVWFKVNILGDARIDDGAVRRGEESSVSDDRGLEVPPTTHGAPHQAPERHRPQLCGRTPYVAERRIPTRRERNGHPRRPGAPAEATAPDGHSRRSGARRGGSPGRGFRSSTPRGVVLPSPTA
jgi:anti-sigma regulatory factor (Ser/Thr protein kinase)